MSFKRDLLIPQYSAFSKTFTYKINGAAVNLTGYTAASVIKNNDGQIIATFTVSINAALGKITLTLSSAQTSADTFVNGYYDILLKPPAGDPKRFGEGSVTVSKGQTENVT